MFKILRLISVTLAAAMALVAPAALLAAPAAAEIGVVVMHGKGGGPGKHVNGLAAAFERAGFQVANLNMPWSHKRRYDVAMNGGVDEITRALDAMRAKGVNKVFVAGHSQGGLFAVYYAGLHRVDGILPIAPGGQVDAASNVANLAPYVEKARQMISAGRGNDKADFAEFEGAKGRAVSSAKCNKLMMMRKEVERLWHKQFGRALPVEALAWSSVELPGNGIKLGLCKHGEVGALR